MGNQVEGLEHEADRPTPDRGSLSLAQPRHVPAVQQVPAGRGGVEQPQ